MWSAATAVNAKAAERHARYAWQLGEPQSLNERLARMSFAMLSAHTTLKAATSAWFAYLETGEWKAAQAYGCTNAHWLPWLENMANTTTWCGLSGIERQPGETWEVYHRRIALIPGFGIAKAAFAIALCYPAYCPLVCVDTWIGRFLYGGDGWGKKRVRFNKWRERDWTRYYAAQSMIQRYGRDWGVPGFVAQWAIWDGLRGKDDEHRFLLGEEG